MRISRIKGLVRQSCWIAPLLLGVITACTDAPSPVGPHSTRTSTNTSPPKAAAAWVPVGSAITLAMPNQFDPTYGSQISLPSFQSSTLVRITVTGGTHAQYVADSPDNIALHDYDAGPSGFHYTDFGYDWCLMKIVVSYQSPGTIPIACEGSYSWTGIVSGGGNAYRTGGGSAVGNCTSTAYPGACHIFSVTSTQTVKVERLDADLTLTTPNALPSLIGDTVTFNAGVEETPELTGFPANLDSWEWTPTGGNPVGVCSWTIWTCKLRLTAPGTMKIRGKVNGVAKTKELYIPILKPVLKISPPVSWAHVGETTTHTASIMPTVDSDGDPIPWSVTNWKFRLAAPLNSGWIEGFSCAGLITCVFGPFTSPNENNATISVYATINGVADSAKVPVIVVPCPTNNLPLDDPNVRIALKAQQDSSVTDGHERGGWIFYNPQTGRYAVLPDIGTATDCEFHHNNAPPLSLGPDWIPTALYHTHMRKPTEILTCPRKYGLSARNGPSPEDLAAVDASGRPQYVIDHDEVWYVSFPSKSVGGPWKYRNTTTACTW